MHKTLKPGTHKNVPVPSAVIDRMNLVEIYSNLAQDLLKHNVGFIKPLRLGIDQRLWSLIQSLEAGATGWPVKQSIYVTSVFAFFD